MKILLISEYFPKGENLVFSGGVEARTYFIAKNLAKHHKVIVITSKLKGTRKYEIIHGIEVYRVGKARDYQAGANILSLFSILSFIKQAIKTGNSLEPDIVDGGNVICHFIARQIANKHKIPVVFWYPDVYIGQWMKTSGVISGLSGWFLEKYNLKKKANKFISISNQTTNKLVKNSIPLKLIQKISCGVDLSEYKLKINASSPKSIICISRLVKYKNVSDLIWAFAMVRKKGINCDLKIVGTGPDKEKLKKIAMMLNLKKHVIFFENLPRKDLVRLIKSSAIFCSPSSVEGFGISVIEAAASGIPSVISNIDIYKEITKNGKGTLFFKEKNIKDLSSKIEKLFIEEYVYRKKQKEALKLGGSYEWKKIASQTESIYKNLI